MVVSFTIFSETKKLSTASPEICGKTDNEECHKLSTTPPAAMFAIFASFWKYRENLVNKANWLYS
jgi:hypothetical protein